jgi:plastocyanin
MRVGFTHVAAWVPVFLVVGCGDSGRPTTPLAESPALSGYLGNASQPHASPSVRLVSMMDACDPETFDAAIRPGTCIERQGGVAFSSFMAELTRTQKAGAWQFAPLETVAGAGQTLLAVNRGGEMHTFTRVAAFGGGVVPDLNTLSGNPAPAPECLNLDPDDMVPPGGTYEAVLSELGTQQFQCCIHPWMRITVRAQ